MKLVLALRKRLGREEGGGGGGGGGGYGSSGILNFLEFLYVISQIKLN